MKTSDFVTQEMIDELVEKYPDEFDGIAASEFLGNGQIRQDKNTYANVSVQGTTSEYIDYMKLKMYAGRNLTKQDNKTKKNVCIVADTMAKQYFGDENPIGEQITYAGSDGNLYNFTIVGIYEYNAALFGKVDTSVPEKDRSTTMFIPIQTCFKLMGKDQSGYTNFNLMVNSVAAIGRMIDEKDNYTRQHSQRVADYSRLIAENLKSFHPTEKEVDQIYRSALLHDIGKIAIPDAILKKTSRLTDEEYAIMKTHPVWGKKILAGLSFLPQADYGASYHHERYDGKGYPEGIRTDDLPYIVRIISAADALDAMNSNRCYRKQCSRNYIISEFEKGSGTQFDPEVAETVIYLIEEGKIEIPEGENA